MADNPDSQEPDGLEPEVSEIAAAAALPVRVKVDPKSGLFTRQDLADPPTVDWDAPAQPMVLIKQGTALDDADLDDTAHEQSANDETANDETAHDETANDKSADDESENDESATPPDTEADEIQPRPLTEPTPPRPQRPRSLRDLR